MIVRMASANVTTTVILGWVACAPSAVNRLCVSEIPARSAQGSPRRPCDVTRWAQHQRTGYKTIDTAASAQDKTKPPSPRTTTETMSLPPALLNLVDQAKDALWAVTACMFHPSAKVKVNGRTCAYLLQLPPFSFSSFV